jgi:hypothetical protein
MTISGPPSAYFFEDRTGVLTGSDFDEVYDRAFLRISSTPQRTRNAGLMVYDMGQRSTSLGDRDRRHFYREPVIVLDFGPRGALGTIRFTKGSVSMPMHQYLRKVSLFSGCVVFASERFHDVLSYNVAVQVSVPEVHGFGWERIQVGPSHARRARVDGTVTGSKFDEAMGHHSYMFLVPERGQFSRRSL